MMSTCAMSEDALIRLENLKNLKLNATELSERVGGRYTYWKDLMAGNKSFGEKAARKIEAALGLARGELDQPMPRVIQSIAPSPTLSASNHPLALADKAQVAINGVASLGQILQGLAGYFETMDDSTRRIAVSLLGQLADNPSDHARIAAMIELSIHSKFPKRA